MSYKTLLFAASIGYMTIAAAQTSAQCPAGRIPLMMLGTFHMAGSNQDAVNFRFDDMGTPKRQAEILDLVDRLSTFRPTKVAIESSRVSTVWNDRYTAWLSGSYAIGFNEIEQVGFRVAKKMNLKALSTVDYPMWMSGLTPIERHDPKPAPSAATPATPSSESAVSRDIRNQLEADEKKLSATTVAAYLAYLNSPIRAAAHNRWDVISNLEPGTGVALYEKTDLATNWYKRNLRIYTNLIEASEPGDRLLFIIGVGHVHLLRTLLSEDSRFCLVSVDDYLK